VVRVTVPVGAGGVVVDVVGHPPLQLVTTTVDVVKKVVRYTEEPDVTVDVTGQVVTVVKVVTVVVAVPGSKEEETPVPDGAVDEEEDTPVPGWVEEVVDEDTPVPGKVDEELLELELELRTLEVELARAFTVEAEPTRAASRKRK
jgi:hypothetical protein